MSDTERPEDEVISFGKYRGSTLGDVLAEDPSYLDWLNGLEHKSNRFWRAVEAVCAKYAAEIERAVGD